MTDNKQQMQVIMDAMAQGSLQPLFDAMADDMRWRWMGTDDWSRTFEGKEAVVGELFGAVQEMVSPNFTTVVHRIIADDKS